MAPDRPRTDARVDPRSIRGAVPRLRPPPPAGGGNNVVLLILDSCRWDSLVAAAPPALARLGPIERRWAWATWTAPAHYNLLMGLLPHTAPTGVPSSAVYQALLGAWGPRLGVDGAGFLDLLPSLWLPHLLRARGYALHARVSLPVLHPSAPLAAGFDSWTLMPRRDALAQIIDELHFLDDRPSFWLINAGETHYPYQEDPRMPQLPGLRGAARALAAGLPAPVDLAWPAGMLEELHQRQIAACVALDPLLHRLLDRCPPGTRVIVTADHGECFGEGGFFGHGPIPHEKVLEVPYVEGSVG
jgi:hypothetical protein